PGGHELRERVISYIADFDPKKSDIAYISHMGK
ncbi:unnamed protein product, partial [marine sediment metagenome]